MALRTASCESFCKTKSLFWNLKTFFVFRLITPNISVFEVHISAQVWIFENLSTPNFLFYSLLLKKLQIA